MIDAIVTFAALFALTFSSIFASALVFAVWGSVVFAGPSRQTPIPSERDSDAIGELYQRLETEGADP
jgi:hypothetical protein